MIENELDKILSIAKKENHYITREKAFDILMCSIYCYKSIDYKLNWYDLINENITDGKNDGGIDFVYFDDENTKVVIGQNKYSKNIKVNDIFAEVSKINNTLYDFDKEKTTSYSREVKKLLRNSLDRLTDEEEGNVEIVFSSTSQVSEKEALRKVNNVQNSKFVEFNLLNEIEIEKVIEELKQSLEVAKEYKFEIDKSKNALRYESDDYKGIVVNISATSLKIAYEKFERDGLFNMNIRRYIKSKNVDDPIIHSMRKSPEDFWVMNNGITIACNDYILDGDNIKVYDFSIVNGGQTTHLIAKNLDSCKENFYVICKIIKKKNDSKGNERTFFNSIAEATNSQKSIQPKDLKANAPEMVHLHKILIEQDIYLEIKRGIPTPRKYSTNKIKNEEFAQIFYSFVYQKPGTARSSKRSLFANNNHYKSIFKLDYASDNNKVKFIKDLIDLNKRIGYIIQGIKDNNHELEIFDNEHMIILNNGKYSIIAIIGLIYRIVNNDPGSKNKGDLVGDDFVYGEFLSNYKEDDIDEKLKDLIVEYVQILKEIYDNEFTLGNVTSPSNFFKTDKKYIDKIASKIINNQKVKRNNHELIDAYGDLFRRKL
ncbi:AIPR family protein [Mammaliicoccus sp. K-M42]|uniref:AIPR family protein n=1 Tax=Mammaliicoccus sp. K-M42 TaxID=2898701 RepID=UPI001EFAFB0A|nr:AIPR family protein [Mammaliicoccus sp. K-M42]